MPCSSHFGSKLRKKNMIKEISRAPDFELSDHLGRRVSLSYFRGKRHVLLAFYPLDFTPT